MLSSSRKTMRGVHRAYAWFGVFLLLLIGDRARAIETAISLAEGAGTASITERVPYVLTDPALAAEAVFESAVFRTSDAAVTQLGYSDQALWLRLAFQNPQERSEERWLDFSASRWTRVEIYGPFPRKFGTGTAKLRMEPTDHHLLLHLTMEPNTEAVWLLKVQSPYSLQWSIDLLDQRQLMERKEDTAWWVGTYLGMTLFALAFFGTIVIENRSRLAIDLFLLIVVFNLGFVPGYLGTFQRLQIGGLWLAERSLLFSLCLTTLGSFHLMQRHLAISTRWVVLMKSLSWLAIPLMLSVAFFWTPMVTRLAIFYGLFCLITGTIILVRKSRDGSRLARLLLLAWVVAGGSHALYTLAAYRMINFSGMELFVSSMAPILLFGGVVVLAVFSVALADDYRSLQINALSVKQQKDQLMATLKSAQEVQVTFIQGDCDAEPYAIRTGYFPCEETGGDWLGYRYVSQQQQLYLAIADVDGHGIAAALFAGSIHGGFYSETLAAETVAIEAQSCLRNLVDHLHKIVHITDHSSVRSATFASCCLDLREGRVYYVNAGHNPLLLVRKGHTQTLFTVGSPLGFSEEPILGEASYPLEPGDRILLFTDGILQGSEERAKQLRLEDLAACMQAETLDVCKQRLELLIQPADRRVDDCTYILCEYRAGKT